MAYVAVIAQIWALCPGQAGDGIVNGDTVFADGAAGVAGDPLRVLTAEGLCLIRTADRAGVVVADGVACIDDGVPCGRRTGGRWGLGLCGLGCCKAAQSSANNRPELRSEQQGEGLHPQLPAA